jgi:ribosomal protein S18 acetylase RimI-like enzyme
MEASEMIATGDRELGDCTHRLVEWTIPMPDAVTTYLRERQWIANQLIFMLHDGRAIEAGSTELVEVDFDAVRELRDIWHSEDFGEHTDTDAFHSQAREVATRANVRVIAALDKDRPIGFAQVETHDGGSEIAQVFVHPEHRGAGLGAALTTNAIRAAAETATDVWICAARDDRPRRLYERLGFQPVTETGLAILPPKP